MRGGALTYRATKNEKLYSVLVKTALDLISTQQENGRITTYGEGKEFCGWDLWSSKYVMLGLLYHEQSRPSFVGCEFCGPGGGE